MQANELQINDWVYENDTPIRTKGYHMHGNTAEALSPIPLTKDMLKTNFGDGMDANEHFWIYYGFSAFDGKNNLRELYFVDISDDYDYVNCRLTYRYVHELQHALRLCGLKDLAENFKIE